MKQVLIKNADGLYGVSHEGNMPDGAAVVFTYRDSMNPLNNITLVNDYSIHVYNPRVVAELFRNSPLMKIHDYDDCRIDVFLLEECIESIPMTGIDFESIQVWCNVYSNLNSDELIQNLTTLANQLKEKISKQNEDIASCKGLCFGIVNNTLTAEEALERVIQLNDSLRIPL